VILVGPVVAQTPTPKGAGEAKTNTSPALPPDYRKRMATVIARSYAEESKGRPEISAPVERAKLFGEAEADVCVRYPADVKFSWAQLRGNWFQPRESDTRVFVARFQRNVIGPRIFQLYAGPKLTCAGYKGWNRFTELEQAAITFRADSKKQ
jgi:hypothetical protein